jgi:hypothetical protein
MSDLGTQGKALVNKARTNWKFLLYYFVKNVTAPAIKAESKGNIMRLPTHFLILPAS